MVFVNTLSADGKYPVHYRENFRLRIQIQLSKKQKSFSNFLFDIWNLHQILNIFKKKMMVIANIFPNLQTVKILVRPLSRNRFFRKRLVSQHLKVSRILEEPT